ncbi:MAG TPA: TonB family protein [Candidatus Dormibacteraeota bacterium]|nr:TonB family protein [Candidatus Dormibacteraeota bacterium]
MALPHAQAQVFDECAAAEPQEQELEKDASRRLHAILEWRENYENGVLYSGLRDYLSENQQEEIDDTIRLTLTARQLQFSPKNVAYVFDALSKAGGKLATLLEIAQRNKTQQGSAAPAKEGVHAPAKAEAAAPDAERHAPVEAIHVEAIHPPRDRRLHMRTTPASRAYVQFGATNGGSILNISATGMAVAAPDPLVVEDCLPRIRFQLPSSRHSIEISAQIVWLAESKKSAGLRFLDLTAEARQQISNWIAPEKPAPEFAALTPAPVESLMPAALESFPEEPIGPIGNVFPEPDQPSSPARMAHTASPASKIATPEILDAYPPSFVEQLHEKAHHYASLAGFAPQVRTRQVASSAHRLENSPSRLYGLEISGSQVAAVVFFFAVISLAVGLTAGRGALGKRLWDTQNSIPTLDATSPALLNRPGEATSRTSTPSASAQSLHARPEDSAARVGPTAPSSAITTRSFPDSDNPEASPERKSSTGLIARTAPPPANSQPALAPRAVGPMSGAPANPAPRRVTPAMRAPAHGSSPSTILVSGPGDGSKPFRLVLPEKTIAASSSFAMTSQLSVLVAPEPGPAPAHKSARLQAGELVSFAWPRYPRPGDRHGSSETVKVRTTIGELGQVLDVKHVSGSTSLLPAAMSAIRQWRYQPTLLDSRPVQTQRDVTIEFRPPQHSHVPARHPSHH